MSGSVGVIETAAASSETALLRPNPPLALPPRLRAAAAADSYAGFAGAIRRALDERRLFVVLPPAVIAGLVTSVAGARQPDPTFLALVPLACAFALPVAWRHIVALRVLALGAAFWLGFSLLAIHGALFGTAMLARPAYGTYELRVDEVISEPASGPRIVVSAITPVAGARALPIRRARIVVRGGPHLTPGDIIRAPVRFYPVPGSVVPGGFDTQFHAYFDGIGAYGNTTRAVEILHTETASTPECVVDVLRRAIGARIDSVLDQPSAGIARALITGDQSAVGEDARKVMATAGLAHVLSISGLHLTLVAGSVFVTLRMLLALSERIARHLPVKRVAAAGGIAAALLYFTISGGSVAAIRATIMIILVLGAVIFGRRALTMRNVAIAASIVLLTDPASVFRPSFQLSFSAVVALIGAWELSRGREGRERSLPGRFLGYFGGIAVTSLVAGAATLLFSIYHFQQTSPLGVLGNLVSLPLVGFVMMPSAMLAALAMPLGFEAPFLAAMGWSIDRMLDLAALVTALSSGIDASPLLVPLALMFGLAALAWFAFLPTWHRVLGPALAVPAIVLFGLDRPPDVLIADTTQAIAVRLDSGLAVVAGKLKTFAVDVWRETYGEPLEAASIACDSIACIGRSERGFSFALVKDPAGFHEECGADLIITRLDAPASCSTGTVVDARKLLAGGVHWLAWNAGQKSFEIRTAIPDRERPWRAPL
jgi:competence protein ComEC